LQSRVEEHQGRSRGEKEKVKMYHRRQEQHVRDPRRQEKEHGTVRRRGRYLEIML
jgi:hypothetical protein